MDRNRDGNLHSPLFFPLLSVPCPFASALRIVDWRCLGNKDVHKKFSKKGIRYKLFDSAMEAVAFLSRPGVTGLIFRKVRLCVVFGS